ncbi:hypothetical protein JST99_00805 [Candidatus Dependentiae bacterium]|nr:hypothetical protein [Candidatus Dependentiae bacterium]
MNYRTLILTAFMVIGCMSNAAEHRPQTNTGNSLLNASIWALGGLTTFLGIKTGYHFVQARRYDSQVRNSKDQHNQKAQDRGVAKFQEGQLLGGENKKNAYDRVSDVQFLESIKDCVFRGHLGFLWNKVPETSYPLTELSETEKNNLSEAKNKITALNDQSIYHTDQHMKTTALFFLSGLTLAGAYLFKNRSSQKS